MRAAIFRNGDIVVDTMPEPTPGVGQVLVKTLACGICGSDLHAAKHAHRMVEISKRIPGRAVMDLSRDVVFGHEFCCEVIEYGPQTEGKLKPGARVCAMPALLFPDGNKGIGYSNDFVGGYAERMVLAAPLLLEVPNGLPTEHAALTEPLAVGVHAVEKAELSGEEAPLVVGCGPVGLAVIAALRLKGLRPIVAADFSPKRRELAARMGADIVVDPAKESPFRKLPVAKRAAVFECVGVPGMIQQVFEAAPRAVRDPEGTQCAIRAGLHAAGVRPCAEIAGRGCGRRRGAGHRQGRARGREGGFRGTRQPGAAHQDTGRALALRIDRTQSA